MKNRMLATFAAFAMVSIGIAFGPNPVSATSGDAIVIAGQNESGYFGDGGPATDALLSYPQEVAFDQAGNMFIADTYNSRLRKVNTDGIISTVAPEQFNIQHIALDENGSIFVSRWRSMYRIDGQTGEVNLIGELEYTTDPNPISGISVDSNGILYLAVEAEGRVYTMAQSGEVSLLLRRSDPAIEDDETVVPDLFSASDVAVDTSDNLYIADRGNQRVFKRDVMGAVTIFAGTGNAGVGGDRGPAVEADLNNPSSLTVDLNGNVIIGGSMPLRLVDPSGRICRLAYATSFVPSGGLSTDSLGNVYFPSQHRIVKIEQPYCLGSAWDQIKDDPDLELFRQLVEADNRQESFDSCPNSSQGITAFAPVDSVIEDLADSLGMSTASVIANPALRSGFINDHVSRWKFDVRSLESGIRYWTSNSDFRWEFSQQPSGPNIPRKVGENLHINGRFILDGRSTCSGSVYKINGPILWPPYRLGMGVQWSGPSTPTSARELLFEIRFDQPASGLTTEDVENIGSQQDCTRSLTKGDPFSEYSTVYLLSVTCDGAGTFVPKLKSPVTTQSGTRFLSNAQGPAIDMVAGRVLEIKKRGDGQGVVESTVSAIDCGPLCFGVFNPGTQVTLRATPEPGSHFAGWTGACRGTGTCTVRLSAARTVTAEFQQAQVVVITKTGSGSGAVTSRSPGVSCTVSASTPCISWHPRSQVITLQAAPARGSRFVGWMGACTGTGRCVIPAVADSTGTLGSATHVFAVFRRN